MPSLTQIPAVPNAPRPIRVGRVGVLAAPLVSMKRRSERLERKHRIRVTREYARVKENGSAARGAACLLLYLATPGEDSRVGFIASKRSVGGAVERNRARRRLRETVRRRWADVPAQGLWMVFIAYRGLLAMPQADLVREIDALLARAGALASDTGR